MSAQPIPAPSPKKTQVCKVPLTYFARLLQEFDKPSDRACFGLVLNETTKLGVRDGYAAITPEQFAEVSGVEQEWVDGRVKWLVDSGWVKRRYVDGRPHKGYEYAVAPELSTEKKGVKILGRCAECKQIGQFTTEFIPTHRTFFTTLAAGLARDNDASLAIAVITRYSHERAWTPEGTIVPKWVTLDLNDFERMTGLDRRSMTNGIATLEELNLIECDRKPGKATRYRTLPENWSNLKARGPRLVEQPIDRKPKGKAKTDPTPPTEKPANPKKPMQPSRYGFCVTCNHIVEVEPVSEAEIAEVDTKPASGETYRPQRAGPARETGKKSKFWSEIERRKQEAIDEAWKDVG